jgi:hypothetical protein
LCTHNHYTAACEFIIKKNIYIEPDIDQNAETSSSDGSGIDIVAQNGTNGLFASHNNYQHLVKNGEMKLQVSSINIIFLQTYTPKAVTFLDVTM